MGSLKVLWPTGRSGSAWYAVAAPIYLACSSFELPETCRSSTAPYDILEADSALAENDRTSAFAAVEGGTGEWQVSCSLQTLNGR